MFPLARLAAPARIAACVAGEIASLVTRLLMLHVFTPDGLGKWRNHEQVTDYFGQTVGIPAPSLNAWFVAGLQIVGGIALAIGLGTRAFALLLAGTMAVALLTADRSDVVAQFPWGTEHDNLMSVGSLPPLMGLLWLIARGGGALSVDRLIWRAVRGRLSSPPAA